MSLLTVERVMRRLTISATSGSVDADDVQDTIDAAEELLAQIVGPLVPTSVTSVVTGVGGGIALPVLPVISVDTLTSYLGQVIPGASVLVSPGGVLRGLGYAPLAPGQWTVAYTAGRPQGACPAPLKQAALELTAHLWATQRGAGGSARPNAQTPPPPPGAAHSLPYRVQELISPYELPGIA